MGSGASTLEKLGEIKDGQDQLKAGQTEVKDLLKASQVDVRNYAGDRFSESKYSELKNDGGFVSRESLLNLHQNELDSNKALQSHKSMPTTRLGPPSREKSCLVWLQCDHQCHRVGANGEPVLAE